MTSDGNFRLPGRVGPVGGQARRNQGSAGNIASISFDSASSDSAIPLPSPCHLRLNDPQSAAYRRSNVKEYGMPGTTRPYFLSQAYRVNRRILAQRRNPV